MTRIVPVNTPLVGVEEKAKLIECIDTGWISSEGPFVAEFENKLSSLVNREYGISCSNGTAAIEMAIKALGIGVGDEVILPSFSIISCIAGVIRAGATPVLVDCDPYTWNMNAEDVANAITVNTSAILIVHTYGIAVDVDPLLELAKLHSLAVIEDAAESIGGYYKAKPCGSFGDISTFSFYANKHITTGEGGMVVTNSISLAERCRSLRNLCFRKGDRFVHDDLGWNYRLTNLQAAIGVAQLEKLEKHLKIKLKLGSKYSKSLSLLEDIQQPIVRTEYAENIFWVYGLLNKSKKRNAKSIMADLQRYGIGTRPFFCPMHQQPVFKGKYTFNGFTGPVSADLYENGFYLPSGVGLTYEDQEYVISTVIEVLS